MTILFKGKKESVLFNEGRTYLKPGEKPPEGIQVKTGSKGGKYYEEPGAGKVAEPSKEPKLDIKDIEVGQIVIDEVGEKHIVKGITPTMINLSSPGETVQTQIKPHNFIKQYKKEPVSKPELKPSDVDYLTKTNSKIYQQWQIDNDEKIADAFIDSDGAYQTFKDDAAGKVELTKDNFEKWAMDLDVKDIPEDFKKNLFAKGRVKGEKPEHQYDKMSNFMFGKSFLNLSQKDQEEVEKKYLKYKNQ